jgi:hypothetical protein
MPDLSFQVTGVDASIASVTPSLRFKVQIKNSPAEEAIQAVLLNAQVQFQPAQRAYTTAEQEKLVELFGPPEVWGQTLRNRLWANVSAICGAFQPHTEAFLTVPCSYDLDVAATRYFHSLSGGEVSLLFLFSGSIFYINAGGQLQVAPISWNHESVYRIPAAKWRELMDRYYPNSAFLTLQREVFDRLCAFKRTRLIATWEEAMDRLLQTSQESDARKTSKEPIETMEAIA